MVGIIKKTSNRSWYEREEYSDITTNYERQYRNFKNTMDIVEELFDITMHTFGSPYNQNDETFVEAINHFPTMKVVFFPRIPVSKQMELSIKTDNGRLNIENGTGNADFNYFLTNYNNYNHSMEYMVLQAHRGNFSSEVMESFKQICNYLIEQGHTFMTPHEYFIHKTSGIMQVIIGSLCNNVTEIRTKLTNSHMWDSISHTYVKLVY